MTYSCAFNGTCEEDAVGKYASLEECQAACEGQEQKELTYFLHSYEPRADELAPSDRVRVIREITGVRLSPAADSYQLLTYLQEAKYESLLLADLRFRPYLQRDPFRWLVTFLQVVGNWYNFYPLGIDQFMFDHPLENMEDFASCVQGLSHFFGIELRNFEELTEELRQELKERLREYLETEIPLSRLELRYEKGIYGDVGRPFKDQTLTVFESSFMTHSTLLRYFAMYASEPEILQEVRVDPEVANRIVFSIGW